MTPKQADHIIRGVIIGVVAINVGLAALLLSGYRPTQKIIHENLASSQNSINATVDWQAKVYLDGFVQNYFNFPEQAKGQQEAIQVLNQYYGKPLPVVSQGLQRTPSKFISMQLLSLTSSEASYRVNYQAGKVTTREVKEGKKTIKQNIVTYQNESTVFHVPYKKIASGYYVSEQPYFTGVYALQAPSDQISAQNWSAADDSSPEVKAALDQFTKTLFTAYTKDGNTLKLISSGLSLNTSESFKSLDQSVYKSNGDKYDATVQITMENALGTHVENYHFTIEKQHQSYFATNFTHTLQATTK